MTTRRLSFRKYRRNIKRITRIGRTPSRKETRRAYNRYIGMWYK